MDANQRASTVSNFSSSSARPVRSWRSSPESSPRMPVERIHLGWLVKLRWIAVTGQLIAGALLAPRLGVAVPLGALAALIAAVAASNLWAERALRKGKVITESRVFGLMAIDVLVLTLLLHLTGGPTNPFSTLFLVHIALAAVVLRPTLTWVLVGLAFAGYGTLFVPFLGAATQRDSGVPQQIHHAHNHAGDLHLQGMWIAFGLTAVLVVYFVTRLNRDLHEQQAELERVRSAASRNAHLASLATLAAGTAHELGTPLSTIAIAAKEMERDLAEAEAEGETENAAETLHLFGGDVRLIRREVDRCRTILTSMSSRAGQEAADPFVETTLGQLVKNALSELPAKQRVALDIDMKTAETPLLVPLGSLARALRGLIKNGLQAGGIDDDGVSVTAQPFGDAVRLDIVDHGTGMAPEVLERAGEPFFTTRQVGEGMGLGIFLARAVLEELGGDMSITSSRPAPQQAGAAGTTVRLTIPRGPCPASAPSESTSARTAEGKAAAKGRIHEEQGFRQGSTVSGVAVVDDLLR